MERKLMKLLKYGSCPTCFHCDLLNGKKYRKKFTDYNSFLAHAAKDDLLKEAEIEDVYVQKSLLDSKDFLMIYAHQKGVEIGE